MGIFDSIWDGIKTVGSKVVDGVKSIGSKVAEGVSYVGSKIADNIGDIHDVVSSPITKGIVGTLATGVGSLVGNPELGALALAGMEALDTGSGLAKDVIDRVKPKTSTVEKAVVKNSVDNMPTLGQYGDAGYANMYKPSVMPNNPLGSIY